jgi:hypothetical protein
MRLRNIFTSIILVLGFSLSISAKDVTVVSGSFKSKSRTAELKTFAVSKGDVIEIKLNVDHKKKGLDIWMKQHPGDVLALNYEEFRNGTKKIVAPADAIYQIFYRGRVEFNIEVINHTEKPNGPGKGAITYVCMPDTLYASGYVDKEIGESYTLSPKKDKVILSSVEQSETVCTRDFLTGVDIMKLSIPGDQKDEYREQKLLEYSVSLIVQSPGVYNKMMGVVDAGVDAFVKMPDLGGKKGKNNKSKKMDHNHRYEFTDDLGKEQEKWENTTELLSIAQETADSLAPNSPGAKAINTAAFLLDTDGMKQMALNKGLEAVGAPKEIMSLVNTVEEFPSATDILKDGIHKYAPSIKGKAKLEINETHMVEKSIPEIPLKEFWIQSAMNYGQNSGGCWDVPGDNVAAKKGLNIQVWNIGNGADRKFKFVSSQKYPGYYEIHSGLTGMNLALDNSGGDVRMQNKGNNIHFWERHGGKCQLFRIEHKGGGKFRIYNYDGFAVCLKGRKNNNGSNVHIWEDHNGNWMDWYLVDPATRKGFVPTESKKALVWETIKVLNKTGGAINEKIQVATKGSPLELDKPTHDITVHINKEVAEAKAKLLIEARYQITDYTDVIKYDRTTQTVNTKDFWTAYKVKYNYAIMFKDQVKDYYKSITKQAYENSSRPTEEVTNSNDREQAARLIRYKTLTSTSEDQASK